MPGHVTVDGRLIDAAALRAERISGFTGLVQRAPTPLKPSCAATLYPIGNRRYRAVHQQMSAKCRRFGRVCL